MTPIRSSEMANAWVVRELGTPDKLRFETLPSAPSPAELVRIRVRAAAVNFFDLLQIGGTYQVKPELPFVPGAEVAGEVEAAPAGSGFEPGDRVLAAVSQDGTQRGGYTEVTHAEPDAVLKIPQAMSFAEAAAFFINYQTGWFGLHRQRAPQLIPECTEALFRLYAAGKIRPYVGRQAPLADAVTLLHEVASRQTTGKAVLIV